MYELVSWRMVKAIIDTIYNGDDDALYNENSDDGIDYDRQERKKFTINMIT